MVVKNRQQKGQDMDIITPAAGSLKKFFIHLPVTVRYIQLGSSPHRTKVYVLWIPLEYGVRILSSIYQVAQSGSQSRSQLPDPLSS